MAKAKKPQVDPQVEAQAEMQARVDKLNKLSKVVRYAGLNLTPQILSLILDGNVVTLVNKINDELEANDGNLDLDSVDAIIAEIDKAAQAEQEAQEAPKPTKLDKV